MLSVLRLCLLLGVILGVVLPKSSAALAQFGVIDARVVVICTAQGLQRITLGGDDDAPRVRHEAPCLLVHALDGAARPPQDRWMRVGVVQRVRALHDQWRRSDAPSHGFARAPPRG